MTQITTTKRICEHLEKYVYDRIWNEPYTEFRTYTRPGLLNKSVTATTPITDDSGKIIRWETVTSVTPYSGFFSGRYSRILLPPHKSPSSLEGWLPTDSEKFFVYAVPARFFDSFKLDIKEWTLLSDYCTENCVDLHVFTQSGFFLNRGAIYLCQADMNDCMLLAIDADMVQELFGDYSEVGNILFGKYVDSDGTVSKKITVAQLSQNQVKSSTRTDITSGYDWKDFTYFLYNGKLVTDEYMSVATANSYIEGVNDDDIVGYFEVDCNTDRPVYYNGAVSPANERLLVHVPSKLNPNRYLITPHTCDMWLVPTEMSIGKPVVSGSYITLAGNEHVVRQITHSDFSIDTSYLSTIASSHHFIKYKLRVYVRYHNKKKEFVRDYNYIDMLYNLDDAEITKFLLGVHEWQQENAECSYDPNVTLYWYKDSTSHTGWACTQGITSEAKFNEAKAKTTEGKLYKTPSKLLLFWKADHLEDCKYADALIRRRNGKYQDPSTQCSICPNQTGCLGEKAYLEDKPVLKPWETDRINELKSYGIGAAGTVRCEKFIKYYDNQCELCRLKYDTDLSGVTREVCTKVDLTKPKTKLGYDCPSYHTRNMRDYIQILGYFHVLSLVGKRVWHFKVLKDNTYDYYILAPLALSYPELNPTDFHCIVYHNGYRINQDRILVSSTNKENTDAEEMQHGTGCLSRSTLVIQSNFATKLQVSVIPEYEECKDHRIHSDKKYYKLDDEGEVVSANICQSTDEFNEMSFEQKCKVDYIVGDLVNKDTTDDPEMDYVLATETHFTNRVYYVRENEEEEFNPILIKPGDEGDYQIGDEIAKFCEEHDCKAYHKALRLKVAKEEFKKDDTVCIEVYDDRRRINETTKVEEPGIQILPAWSSPDPRTITTYTDDQYQLYKISEIERNTFKCYKYERVPDDEMGTLEVNPTGKSFTLTINSALNSSRLLFLEGPKVVESTCTRTVNEHSALPLGMEFYSPDAAEYEGETAFPLDSAVVFMNNRRLIPNLDYYLDRGVTDYEQIFPYIQNAGYIWNGTRATKFESDAVIDYIRSQTTDISTQYGFMIGKKITWAGQAPFWFDELSTLTVDGAVCSNFKHSLGMISVEDEDHRNGSPYEIRTACSSRVMDIVGCKDEQAGDMQKIREIRTFFEIADILPRMETIIPHSHKIYSTYLEIIITSFLYLGLKFDTHKPTTDTVFQVGKKYYIKQAGSLRLVTDRERAAGMIARYEITSDKTFKTSKAYYLKEASGYRLITTAERSAGMVAGKKYYEWGYYEELNNTEFEAQFADYSYWKDRDIAYKLSKFDLGFVDVYPTYYRTPASSRDVYNQLRYLNNRLAPVDHIKHKDAIHE